ncbi:hypothetical protein JRQ81_004910, partial [Phrynocephalus forsythii]
HRHQLNVMFVGGPNQRKDYHIEEGEEVNILFCIAWGCYCFVISSLFFFKSLILSSGQMFLLPARIPHSPQRYANTVGLVIERKRLTTETDGLRYYIGETTNVLFERWFYCDDLGTQLIPIIQEFFSSSQYRTGKPNPDEIVRETPFPLNNTTVMVPFSLQVWLNDHREDLIRKKSLRPFGDNFETEVVIFGPGITKEGGKNADIWIWQMEGTSIFMTEGKTLTLESGDSLFIPAKMTFQWKRTEGCIALCIAQDPMRKRPYA